MQGARNADGPAPAGPGAAEGGKTAAFLSVEAARARILARLLPTQTEIVPLPEAWGRVSARLVPARLTNPPSDVSAMDGYALRAADGAAGAMLRVIGEAPAGHPFAGTVAPGETVRLFTGSVLPPGADAILLQEDAERHGESVTVRETVAAGQHIRRAGQDFAAGDTLIPAGRRLGARDIGLTAAGNHPWVAVHRRPRVAILATGDEITLPGEAIGPGGIINANAHALAALVRAGGGEPLVLPIVADARDAIAVATGDLRGCDLLVTTGGASVGAHDLVREGLGARGFAPDFWKIAMRPGKPLMFGHAGEVPVLGLPGNPVAAMVCGLLFLLPALARLSGLPGDPPASVPARLGAPVAANDRRADHLRARLSEGPDGGLVATPFPSQDSARLRLLADADALVLRPPLAPALAAGEIVPVLRLDGFGV
ncbi:MAG TPA: gephyrin-like molybdotransferase Glp [Acetobacteraceae bacterium]|nr:gephyrin-like molybdotransferase Glp [Acetobacteraceae bacterium]